MSFSNMLEILQEKNKNLIYERTYDDVVDYVYRRIKKCDFVIMYGKVKSVYFKITKILIF